MIKPQTRFQLFLCQKTTLGKNSSNLEPNMNFSPKHVLWAAHRLFSDTLLDESFLAASTRSNDVDTHYL